MRKIILTSAGFDNPAIASYTKSLIEKPMDQIKVLFITSAAVTPEQKVVLGLCEKEILDFGILGDHLYWYDFEYELDYKDMQDFDMIYVAGGSTKVLRQKMNDFFPLLEHFLDSGGLYLGVSAGSLVLTPDSDQTKLVDINLKVHAKSASHTGPVQSGDLVNLRDDQAIVLMDQEKFIIM